MRDSRADDEITFIAVHKKTSSADRCRRPETDRLLAIVPEYLQQVAATFAEAEQMTANGMVRPCSCPACDKLARGAKTRSSPCLQQHRLRSP